MSRTAWATLLDAMQVPRIYVDTSVFGGCFDPEFETESRRFFELVRVGRIVGLVSDTVVREIAAAPADVRGAFDSLPAGRIEHVRNDERVEALARAYLEWRVLSPRSWNDAQHVAAASCVHADAIASWNFRDIVSPARIRGFNAMNLTLGYGLVVILSPHGLSRATEEMT